MGRDKLRQRPYRRSANERTLVAEPIDHCVGQRAVIRVSDCDHHIANEALPAGTLDRTAGEERPERRLIEAGELGERGRVEIGARSEFRFPPDAREFVPGADGETIVAAVDPIADRGSKLMGDRTLVLDREIGDAAARVEPVGRGERPRRAGVEAGAALTAMVRFGRVGRQVEVGQDRAQE